MLQRKTDREEGELSTAYLGEERENFFTTLKHNFVSLIEALARNKSCVSVCWMELTDEWMR